MADKPILFSGPMVRALLEGRKTQTRRVLRPQPPSVEEVRKISGSGYSWFSNNQGCRPVGPIWAIRKLAGDKATRPVANATGDRLWVREACATWEGGHQDVVHRASETEAEWGNLTADAKNGAPWKIRSPIHMPKWASRLTLVVTDVRVQRVQEISGADAEAEGVDLELECCGNRTFIQTGENHGWSEGYEECCGNPEISEDPRITFARLWDSINAKRGFGWDENPWVAAYTFDVHKCNIADMPERLGRGELGVG